MSFHVRGLVKAYIVIWKNVADVLVVRLFLLEHSVVKHFQVFILEGSHFLIDDWCEDFLLLRLLTSEILFQFVLGVHAKSFFLFFKFWMSMRVPDWLILVVRMMSQPVLDRNIVWLLGRGYFLRGSQVPVRTKLVTPRVLRLVHGPRCWVIVCIFVYDYLVILLWTIETASIELAYLSLNLRDAFELRALDEISLLFDESC